MQIPLLFLLTLTLALQSGPVFGKEDDKSETGVTVSLPESPKTVPVIPPKAVITLQSKELAKNGSLIDAEIKKKCEQTDYRSYIECLLRETKRKKRQCPNGFCSGYQQCFGTVCFPVSQPQLCPGSGCIQVQQQQPCLGSGCIQLPQQQQQQQQSCSGFGCVFIGYRCSGSGCIQIGQTCYGIGCLPVTNCPGDSCSNVQQNGNNTLGGNEPDEEQQEGRGGEGKQQQPTVIYEGPTAEDVDDLRTEIEDIRDQLRLVKEQNDRLIDITEKATTLILAASNKPAETIRQEPVLLTHNLTTNIDISNYLNNTNVINIPKTEIVTEKNHTKDDRVSERLQEPNSSEKEKHNRTHCCIVVRPKTCRTISRPPYFICGNRKHRTCGTHCGGKRLVHSIVKPECGWNSTESCVSYHSAPYAQGVYPGYPGYSGYPGYPGYPGSSGYYPPTPAYYPFLGTAYYPAYAPPPIPIYTAPPLPIYPPPPMYHSAPLPYLPTVETEEEVVEGCEDCDIETEIFTQECDETVIDCKSTVEKKENEAENENNFGEDSNTEIPRADTLPLDLDPIAQTEDDDETGSKNLRSNPLVALREVEKEAAAIKRSENQLEASLDMLQEAVELKRLEGEKNKEEVKKDKSEKDVEPISDAYTTASNIEP